MLLVFGLSLRDRKTVGRGEDWLRGAAATGDPSAMHALAIRSRARGDVALAEFWLRRAIDASDGDGMHETAVDEKVIENLVRQPDAPPAKPGTQLISDHDGS